MRDLLKHDEYMRITPFAVGDYRFDIINDKNVRQYIGVFFGQTGNLYSSADEINKQMRTPTEHDLVSMGRNLLVYWNEKKMR